MARIKRVFSNGKQVLHLWANQSQSDARSSNVSFEGNRAYSYGHHYTLGVLHKVGKKTVAIINNHRWSVTTCKHIGWALDAVSHIPTISSSKVDSIKGAVLGRKKELILKLEAFFRQRTFWSDYKITNDSYGVVREINNFNEFCDAVSLKKHKIKLTKKLLFNMQTHVMKCISRQIELDVLKKSPEYQKKLQEKKIKQIQADIKTFREGGFIRKSLNTLPFQLLRIKGDMVETSKGASVPLNQARTLLLKILNGKSKEDDPIGAFKLTTVKEKVIQIGCHKIELDEAVQVLKVA